MDRLYLALILGILVSVGAYKVGALTSDGALAAAVIGALTFGFGGELPAGLLVLFFASSSLLSRLGASRKRALVAKFAKGGPRDAGQVLANGGLPTVLAFLYGLTREEFWMVAIVGALAAVTADTRATELGVLVRRQPRLIISGAFVDAGTSGGVTPEGMLASGAGAGLIGLVAGLTGEDWSVTLAALAGGLAGTLLDSLLGAMVQAIYHCPSCIEEIEWHPYHTCGSETRLLRGWRGLNNDGVNFASSVFGAVIALITWSLA